jgi:hypothetical protein
MHLKGSIPMINLTLEGNKMGSFKIMSNPVKAEAMPQIDYSKELLKKI